MLRSQKIIGALLGSVLWVSFSLAANNTINFQGRLTDKNGNPIFGETRIRIEVYDTLEGNNKIWPLPDSGLDGIKIVKTNPTGLFLTAIGPFDPTFFKDDKDYFVQLYVDQFGFQQLSPRRKLEMVPFAFYAKESNKAAQADSADFADTAEISNSIEKDRITSDHIVNDAITQEDLNPTLEQKLIPSGMIGLFARACPAGWSVFPLLVDRVPLGVANYTGVVAGNWTPTGFSASEEGLHAHVSDHGHGLSLQTGPIDQSKPNAIHNVSGGDNAPVSHRFHTHQVNGNVVTANNVPTSDNGAHTHTIQGDGNWRPPYVGVVYCLKD